MKLRLSRVSQSFKNGSMRARLHANKDCAPEPHGYWARQQQTAGAAQGALRPLKVP